MFLCWWFNATLKEDRQEQTRCVQVKGWAETNMAVSFTVYSSTPERGTKQLGSVCWDCPFIPRIAVVQKKKSLVFFCKLQRGLVWAGWKSGKYNF